MSLLTPKQKVRKLQIALQEKAKAEAEYRFYTLWDKVCREDVLLEAYHRCCRNKGAPGVDGQTFEKIEAEGVERWLAKLQEEMRSGKYHCDPLRRKWIPKGNGGERPLGIPTIRDRVAQMATMLVISPIFEADLCQEQTAYRTGVDAKDAVGRVYFKVVRMGLSEVVDADLSDYFNTIPHGPLMKCITRRIVDKELLRVIKGWLEAPVVEEDQHGAHRTSKAADTNRGTPQGGVISPLLANIYFRRFILAWKLFGHEAKLRARIVNYADDLVICCKPGNGTKAMACFRDLISRIGLTVNEKKTRLVNFPEEAFNFLGYTFGKFYNGKGSSYLGTRPSSKAVRQFLLKIREATSSSTTQKPTQELVDELNPKIRGWCNYYSQGPVDKAYGIVKVYCEMRMRRWLNRKHKGKSQGYYKYNEAHIFGELGLLDPLSLLAARKEAMLNAKSC